MKTARMVATGLLWCLVPMIGPEAFAQEGGEAATEDAIRREGISGIIVDDTATFIGRQFYDAFARAWSDQGLADKRNLSVREQPTAISGSRVWVEHNRRKLFEVFLPPIRADIEATARRAATSVAQRFKAMDIERLLYQNPDLAPAEF